MQDVKPSAAREYAMYKYDALFELIGKELIFSHRVTRPSVCPSTANTRPQQKVYVNPDSGCRFQSSSKVRIWNYPL